MAWGIKLEHKGDFSKTTGFLNNALKSVKLDTLNRYGRKGVEALRNFTPQDTGATADSWSYEIISTSDGVRLVWTNSNQTDGIRVAVLIQYGHVTGTGGYVEGRDYINPALAPIFDKLADDCWKELTKK